MSRWRRISALVAEQIVEGHHPVLVCSAVAGVTNALERLSADLVAARDPGLGLGHVRALHERLAVEMGLDPGPALAPTFTELERLVAAMREGEASSPAWRAQLLAFGELWSTRLGAAFLRASGLRVGWIDARELLEAAPSSARIERSPEHYLSAHCLYGLEPDVRERLLDADVDATITQGFIARDARGETVVLGRGGSDTSAAYLASKLGAERLEIWTDVPGLFTADPRVSCEARLIPRISYEEAAVFGSLGAEVLHPRCLAPIRDRGIPLQICWTERPEVAGTIIGAGPGFARRGIKMISSRSNLCLVRMCRPRDWQPVGFMAEVAACFRANGLSMDLISSSPAEIRATVDLAANPGAEARLDALLEALCELCSPTLVRGLACVSIAGTSISVELPRIAAALQPLGQLRIHLSCHAGDDSHLSYVVDADVVARLVTAMHIAVFAEREVGVFGPSWAELQRSNGREVASIHVEEARS